MNPIKKDKTTSPDIYEYTDYRRFLKDYFQEQKKHHKYFSHQYFANKANIKSTGFMLHVMKGERNLTKTVLLKVGGAIGFTEEQLAYFEDLVSFDQAKKISEKKFYYYKIFTKRQSISVTTLEDSQYEFYNDWYHSAIRELVTLTNNSEPGELAKLLSPSPTVKAVKHSLELQEKLGLLKKTKSGYIQSQSFISGGGELRNLAVVNYQKQSMELAQNVWDRHPPKSLTMSTMTLCMSEELVSTIRDETRKFKQKIFQLVANEKKNPERVYQMNLNLFPITKRVGNKSD